MTITITINCDNTAFDDNGIATEAAWIVRKAALLIADGSSGADLRDDNGNVVGKLEVNE